MTTVEDLLALLGENSSRSTDSIISMWNQIQANAAAKINAEQNVQKGYTAGQNTHLRPGQTPSDDTFALEKRSIAYHESRGDYGATGDWLNMSYGRDRAYGKYQVMGNNIASWTQDVLGHSMTPTEFLHDKQAQEAVFNAKFGGLYRQYGPRLAAAAWASGVAGMQARDPYGMDYAKTTMDWMRAHGYSHGQAPPQHNQGPGVGQGQQGQPRWVSPINNMVPTSNFGPRTDPITGSESYHHGIDYGAALGTKVHSAHGGTVVSSGWDPIYGNQVIIQTPHGLEIQYGHLSKINPNLGYGEHVQAGQRIGRVGSTGRSTGPHLHFGVEKNGEWVNPMKYVNRMGEPGSITNAGQGQQPGMVSRSPVSPSQPIATPHVQYDLTPTFQTASNSNNAKYNEILRRLGVV